MLSVRPKQFSRTPGPHRMAGRIEVREPYDDQREQPALPYQGPRAHEQGQVGAEVAQGRAVAQQHDPELAGIVVPVDGEVRCRQTVQATTEASEADQAGLSCRARQTWWITLIVGPCGPSSGQVSGWGGSGPRQIPSEMPAGRRTGSRRARAAGDSESDSAGVSVTLLV